MDGSMVNRGLNFRFSQPVTIGSGTLPMKGRFGNCHVVTPNPAIGGNSASSLQLLGLVRSAFASPPGPQPLFWPINENSHRCAACDGLAGVPQKVKKLPKTG